MNSLLIWPIAIPLAAALGALLWPRHGGRFGVAAAIATLVATGWLLWRVVTEGPLTHALGGWEPGLGIALRADALAVSLLLMSSLVAPSDISPMPRTGQSSGPYGCCC